MSMNRRAAVIIALAVAVIAGIGFWYWQNSKKEPPAPTATEALKEVESAAPEVGVPASPVEGKIPSLNPIEQANPFKYKNPLR